MDILRKGGHGYSEERWDMVILREMGVLAILRKRGTWLY